jgi:hypothetical protein
MAMEEKEKGGKGEGKIEKNIEKEIFHIQILIHFIHSSIHSFL